MKIEKNETKAKKMFLEYINTPQQWNKYAYVTNNPMIYVDPTGEILRLTGSSEDKKLVFSTLKEMLGEKAAKNLTYTVEKDGSWTVTYDENGDGQLAIGGEFGVALEQIIDSSKNVSLSLTPNTINATGFGTNIDLSDPEWNGGYTGLGNDNKTINIIIHKDVVKMANDAFQKTGFIGTDRNILKMTFSAAIAHELGHAWGAIKDQTSERLQKAWVGKSAIRTENEDTAVRLENIERGRLAMPLRYQHNP